MGPQADACRVINMNKVTNFVFAASFIGESYAHLRSKKRKGVPGKPETRLNHQPNLKESSFVNVFVWNFIHYIILKLNCSQNVAAWY